ncbi:MAG: O-antigen ligase family protein [Prevotella sp.]|nr:O-antigen ligase family protein [Prevotella sp.]
MKRNYMAVIAMAAVVVFLALNHVMATHKELWFMAMPAALVLVLLFLKNMDLALMATALVTPLSVNVAVLGESELSLPAEPMMILLTVVFLIRSAIEKAYDKRLLRHPVSIAVIVMLLWMVVVSATSQLPLVSFKYTAARLWFVIPFFFAGAYVFRDPKKIRQFFWCYAIGLIAVILISTARTMGHLHDLSTLHHAMKPFYNDHTAYGCVIALFLPAAFYYIFSRNSKGWARLWWVALFGVLVMGLYLSFSRAAWISVVAAVGVFFAVRLGMKIKWMIVCFAVGIGLFFAYQGDLLYKMGKNSTDSSTELSSQVKSMSNISTDASNLERLNRWASALRMWQEHPVLGTGPGTYQFLYASYQRSYQLSVISTNAGDLGNAHSEYIGPLTEQGVPGTLFISAMFLLTFATGVKVYRSAKSKPIANTALAFTLSLLTYYVHGAFNNFLDTDKLSVPFWGFTAVVVALDVFCEKKEKERQTTEGCLPENGCN